MRTLAFAAVIAFTPLAAQAAYIVDLTQEGPNVVATGSGSINTTDLTADGTFFDPTGFIIPNNALIITQPNDAGGQMWFGITGATSFGSGGMTDASFGSGDVVGVGGVAHDLGLPTGYVSGSALMSTSTWDGATFASLGVIPGTYRWTWGSGADADSFTLNILTVPEPGSLALLSSALLGFAAYRRRRS